jgi:basic membrane protein A
MALAFAAVAVLMLGLQVQQPALANGHLIGLVPTEDGVVDDLWSRMAYEGLMRAESELEVTGTVYTPTNSEDYGAKLDQCHTDGNELCISVGFQLSEATMNAATTYTDTNFAIVDIDYESYPDNLRGITFNAKESAYLAGVLAGHMTLSDAIGAVAGMQIPPVEVFAEGYRNGAQCANPAMNVLIEYTGDFGNPEIGAQAAQGMIAQGADVIFGVGGNMGNGAVITATQSGVWGIGVDVDIYTSVFENGALDGSDKLLTSVVKNIDNAVFDTISDVISGTFSAGTIMYGLAENGVGLAPFHEADPYVSQSVRDSLDSTTQGIINGTIDVNYDCRVEVYLPLLEK